MKNTFFHSIPFFFSSFRNESVLMCYLSDSTQFTWNLHLWLHLTTERMFSVILSLFYSIYIIEVKFNNITTYIEMIRKCCIIHLCSLFSFVFMRWSTWINFQMLWCLWIWWSFEVIAFLFQWPCHVNSYLDLVDIS